MRSTSIFIYFNECFLLLLPLLLCSAVQAADITGKVTDPAGATVPRARVNILNASGARVQQAVTDENGQFTVSGLPLGRYAVQVESDVFETAVVDIEVTEGAAPAPLNISLKLKQVKEEVSVNGRAESLTVPDATAAEAQLDTLPGNVSEIQADQFRDAAIVSMSDALTLTPGVFAQQKEGSEEVRLSIRGSGMNVPFGLRGILVLQDGTPVSNADGYSNPEVADVLNADYIEVYRGADGLEYGSSSLGGAINFVNPNGRSQPGFDIRAEFGSYGYRRGQIRYGAVTDNGRLDAFIALSGLYSDGFRQNSKDSSYRLAGNLGYRFSSRSEGRLFVNLERVDERRPGAITLGQLESDPFQAGTGAVRSNALIDFKPFAQVAYKQTFLLGSADILSFHGQYFKSDFNNPTSYANYSGPDQDWGLGVRHEVNRTLFGHKNRFVWGVDEARYWDTENTNGPVYFGNYLAEPNTGILQQTRDHNASSDLFAQDSYSLTSTLNIVVAAQFAYAQRDLVATTPTAPTYYPLFFPNAASRNYTGFNPKGGLLWAPRQKARIFANVSRSFEPPDEYEFSPGSNLANLDAQTATTVEGGARGGGRNLSWDFATYYSWIHKEIFSIESPPNSGNWVTFNRNQTRHAGVEAGMHGRLPIAPAGGSLNWNLTYTWSDFHFVNDPEFGNNHLPIVPPQFARLDLAWHHKSGFYIGPKLEVASNLYVDLANTLRCPGYAVVGTSVGYSREGKYRIFLDFRNPGNKYYAASTEYVENAGGQDTAAFNPGLPRSVFGGIEVKFR